jgi:DivIVA domain-containing protein
MTYSPVELRHVSLKRRLLGYDRAAVDAMLDDVADSYEQVWRDRVDLGDRIELLSAEQAANTVKEKGRSEAGEIIEQARHEAREITRRARAERESLMLDARRIRLLLHAALDAIDEVPADELRVEEPPVAEEEAA